VICHFEYLEEVAIGAMTEKRTRKEGRPNILVNTKLSLKNRFFKDMIGLLMLEFSNFPVFYRILYGIFHMFKKKIADEKDETAQ